MEKILNKQTLIESIRFNKKVNDIPDCIVESFYKNDKLERFPFEIVGKISDPYMPKDVLWQLNSIDKLIATKIVTEYSKQSIPVLAAAYEQEDILKKILKLDSAFIDELLSEYSYNRVDTKGGNKELYKNFIFFLSKLFDYTSNNGSSNKDMERFKYYIEGDKLELITVYNDIILNDCSRDEVTSPEINNTLVSIITSDIYNKIECTYAGWASTLKKLWKLWLNNKVSEDTLKLAEEIMSDSRESTDQDIEILISLFKSDTKLNTNFKYKELKSIYGNELHTLFNNLVGSNSTIITQNEINSLLNNKVDVSHPYESIYNEGTAELKLLKNTKHFSSGQSMKIKELILNKKTKFLNELYNYFEKSIDNPIDKEEFFCSLFNSNIMKNTDILDRYIHLNNLNYNQLKFLNEKPRAYCEDLQRYLDYNSGVPIPKFFAEKYNLDDNLNLYSGKKFNFEEFEFLLKSNSYSIIDLMLILKKIKVKNSRIINICNELLKAKDMENLTSDLNLSKIIDVALNYHSLYGYREKHPITLEPMKNIDNVIYSILFEEDLKSINIKKESEIEFIRKRKLPISHFKTKGFTDVTEIQKDICLKDPEMQKVIELLKVNNDFITKNFENIMSFYTNGLSTVVSTLSKKLTGNGSTNLPLIVKAELSGALKSIKYVQEDYKKEIGLEVSDTQRMLWEKNFEKGNTCEADDFETIIRIGENPVTTCQHWNSSGSYVQSILSNFDTNKKIIVHKDSSGKIDTRAILRLTKMTLDRSTALTINNKDRNSNYTDETFGFKDITNNGTIKESINHTKQREELVLFLEVSYSYLNSNQAQIANEEIIQLAQQKAKEMGIKLVISKRYGDILTGSDYLKNFTSEFCYIYISKSKNGLQYLDSLSGQNTSSNSERYQDTTVYM